jgi:sucrose-phosphate synthase
VRFNSLIHTNYCFAFQTLIMGNREVISKMHKVSAAILTSVLTLIDEYDLYGQVAYPKHHKHSEVPDIYRLAARTKVLYS